MWGLKAEEIRGETYTMPLTLLSGLQSHCEFVSFYRVLLLRKQAAVLPYNKKEEIIESVPCKMLGEVRKR